MTKRIREALGFESNSDLLINIGVFMAMLIVAGVISFNIGVKLVQHGIL